MQFHILMAGEQVGPLTEEQVRQYLGEGRVSASDLAFSEGMESWQPLDHIFPERTPDSPPHDSITPDSPRPEPPADAEPVPTDDSTPSMSNETFKPFELAADAPTEPPTPLTATQKTKRKMSKIVLQPILPLEASALKAKPRTGKLPVTLEPLRPTTALPPVAGFTAKERKPTRTLPRVEQPAPANVEIPLVVAPVEQAAPLPVTPIASFQTVQMPLAPSPDLTIREAMLSATTAWFEGVPRAVMIYAGAALALLILCFVLSGVYLIYIYDQPPPAISPANPVNAPPSAQHASTPPAPSVPNAPTGPQTASDFSERGFGRQSKGDLDGAIADYTQALALDPKNVEVYYRRGLARQAKGDVSGALADDTQVIQLDPKRANAFSNRGYVKQAQGDVDGALADYAQALLVNPKIPGAYYNEGLIDVQKGNLDGAIAAYNKALDLDPKMAVAFYNRGVAKNTEGDLDGAIADYTQALTLDPTIALAFSNRGFARQTKGDTDGAVADYTQALALNPKLVAAFYNRGMIELQKGNLDGALADTTQAIDLDPKNGPAYFKRGEAELGKGNLDSALGDFKGFCDLAPRDGGTDSARLYIWVISTLQDPDSDADEKLSTSLLNDWNATPEDLTSKIGAFLLGHITEGELIANAVSPDPSREPAQYCRVWYFAGMKRLLSGDTTTAMGYFQKSVATGQKNVSEYLFSQAELESQGRGSEVAAKPETAPNP